MSPAETSYAMKKATSLAFDDAVAQARTLLADQGFGVLTEIDVQAKMKEKLDKDMEPYLILGACAPPLAWKGLQAEPDLGVLLPCNVCVYVQDGQTIVSAMDPAAALKMIGNPVVDEVGTEVRGRLEQVLAGI